eukprot:scaffold46497_cov48-Phaeocystis_antarctica.AAC.2
MAYTCWARDRVRATRDRVRDRRTLGKVRVGLGLGIGVHLFVSESSSFCCGGSRMRRAKSG